MKVSEAIRERRSHKFFDPAHQMSEAEITRLLEHAVLSPTAFNIQNWRFVQVDDPQLRREIRLAAWDQPQITDCSLLLVLCMDLQAWDREPERYWRNAPEDVGRAMASQIRDFYRGDPQAQRDEGMRSCALAAMNLMLMAREMGYDSCPMDGFDFKRVAHLIHLPPDHAICMILCIGKSLREPFPRPGQIPLDEVYIRNGF